MGASILKTLVDQEGTAFQQISNQWRPQNLFLETQIRGLILDMAHRYKEVSSAEAELQTLPRAEMYLKLVRQMKFILRRAYFVRRSNHLALAEAVAEFYAAYGKVLRFLKIDEARGHLKPVTVQ